MAYKQVLVLLMIAYLVAGQRPSFAGTKPIGFPDVLAPADPLGNRFGDDSPLPAEAKGDRALVERLSKLPIDKQPFWFINWKALEDNRKNPQSYPQRENSFTNNPQGGASTGQSSANFQSNPPSPQADSAANSGGLTSKFGESNNGANIEGGNFASTLSNNRPNQQGYNRQFERRGYF